MKSLGRIFGLVLLGLLLLIFALGFALTHLFDPNDYKDEIRQLARDKANLELQLNGDIGWSLFPWLGIELHDASLASAATPDQPFAQLQMLGLSVRVLPLLRKEVQMSDIRIEGLNLSLQKDKQGHGNWEDIGKPATANRQPTTSLPDTSSPEATAPNDSPSSQPLRLDIDSLHVSNARIDYRDEATNQQYTLEGVQLTSGAIREGASIPLTLSGFFGINQPVLRARAELSGQLRFDRALKRYQLEDAKLSGEVSGEPLNGKTLTFASQGELLLDQAAHVAEWNSLKLSANQLRALGELKVYDLDKTAKLSGGLSVAQFNLREFVTGLGIKLPAMADEKTLNSAELVTHFSGSPTSLALEELDLKLDDSHFTGRIEIANFERQALRLQLKGDQLDLDRYLPAKAKDSASSARDNEVKASIASAGKSGSTPLPKAPTQQAWSQEPLLPLEQLRKLDVQLALSMDKLTIKQIPSEYFNLKLSSKAGLIKLEQARGELFGGSYAKQGQLDARSDVPQLSGKVQLTKLPLEKLLQASGQKSPIKGNLNLTSDLNSSGNSEKALIDALAGNANFSVLNGVLLDANLEQQLCQGIATLNRKTLSGEPRGKDTPFDELQGSLTFNHGVASNQDLKVRIPGLAVNGDGTIDLRVLGMDYNLGIILEGDQQAMPDPACQINKRYVGIEWPITCRGPLELGAKACRLDQQRMGKVAAKVAGSKIEEKLEEKLGDKLSPELKDALKGLFNR